EPEVLNKESKDAMKINNFNFASFLEEYNKLKKAQNKKRAELFKTAFERNK
ncbi:18961_t:CDS:2, partial [Gigaspora rosea]